MPKAPLGVLSCTHMWFPTAPGKGDSQVPAPGIQGAACRGWERPPWTGLRHWGGETGRQVASPFQSPWAARGDSEATFDSCRGQAVDPSSAPDLDEARSDRDPRWKSPATPAGPTCGMLTPWLGGQTRSGGGGKPSSQMPGFQSSSHLFFISYFFWAPRSTQGQEVGFILCPSSTCWVPAVSGTGSRILKLN